MDVKLLKKTVVVTKDKEGKPLVDATGKQVESKTYTNFYLQLPNGYNVPIKPTFSKDYKGLIVVATVLE